MHHVAGAIKIKNPNNVKIHFTRHAQSTANIQKYDGPDAPLSELGVEQAKLLEGKYDLIYISPLRRCMETLLYSSLTYDKIVVCQEIREKVDSFTDILAHENFEAEPESQFWVRANAFTRILEQKINILPSNSKILIISHGYFFNAWYRRGCFTTPPNAQIYEIF